MRHDVGGLIDDDAVHGVAGVIEVLGDLRLAVDDDTIAAGKPGQVDAVAGAGEGDVEAFVDQRLAVQAFRHLGLAQQRHHAALQDAGADAAQDVAAALAFQDDA